MVSGSPVVDEDLGRRERKKRETRRALEKAALRLATERGPDQVTAEEIADAADVSVRTFFNYFSCKEEAIVGGETEAAILVDRLLARPLDEPPLDSFRNVFVDVFTASNEAWAERHVARQRLVREHRSLMPRHLAAHHALERHLCRALEERLGLDPESSLYPALVVTTAVNAMRLSVASWDAAGRTTRIAAVVEEAFDALGRGLPVPEEMKA